MKRCNPWLVWTGCFFVVLIGLLFAHFAHAHDHNRPELNSWFMGLHSGRGPCCDGSDAFSLDDVDWESHDGHYRVRIPSDLNAPRSSEQIWVDVPDEAVVEEPNRAGPAMVWPMWGDGGVTVRCFLPGSMT